ncbi:Bro-N domain-containing protein [Bacillus mycoides]|uniref:BRO-N domain-containing protein n=2 Tax=Bacillus mycoides TaxID=1405 RepID=UPI00256FBD9E|nr:BRO family protein [Bacillus mycoides]MED1012598.1 BRO family protein [Bacillus mycoides]
MVSTSAQTIISITVMDIHQQEVLGQGFKVYGSIEHPLFLAQDVSEWIGHTNTAMMLKVVDEDEKEIHEFTTLNNNYSRERHLITKKTLLTEEGIYEVLMLSRKPIAKQWKKEVKKILKNIRLNGGHVQVDREEESKRADSGSQLVGYYFLS